MKLWEYIHAKGTTIVVSIVAVNVILWLSLSLLKTTEKVETLQKELKQEAPVTKSEQAPALKIAPKLNEVNKSADIKKKSEVKKETPKKEVQPTSTFQSTLDYVFTNWPTIFTILSSIPVIVLKWKKMFDAYKKTHEATKKLLFGTPKE